MKNAGISTLMLLLLIAISTPTLAQENDTSYWHTKGATALNFNQVALKNWAGGGQSSISFAGLVNASLWYEKGKNIWINSLDIGYGVVRQGRETEPFKKTDDKLHFLSKYSYEFHKHWFFTYMLDFQTSMTPGYEYLEDTNGDEYRVFISDFMAPGYLLNSLGVEYKPRKSFNFLFAPLSVKTTFVLDETLSNQGRYGVDSGEMIRNEFGAVFNMMLEQEVVKNVNFQTQLILFSNYENISVIDVDWKAQLIMKVNKFLSASITTHMIYDEDVEILREDGTRGTGIQFKETLAIGIAYKWGEKD